jgi:hypothetical protein
MDDPFSGGKDMKMSKITIGVALTLVVGLAAAGVFAQPPMGMGPQPPMGMGPPPHMFHMPGQPGIHADQQHVYVLAGDKIMQYAVGDMKPEKTVTLPEPTPPAGAAPEGTEPGRQQPPRHRMGGPQTLYGSGGFLYVVAGPTIYRYGIPDLTLKNTVQLPDPKCPQAGK